MRTATILQWGPAFKKYRVFCQETKAQIVKKKRKENGCKKHTSKGATRLKKKSHIRNRSDGRLPNVRNVAAPELETC